MITKPRILLSRSVESNRSVGKEIPAIGGAIRGLAGAVAYSRVHTGVHYPTDVIIGASIGDVTLALLRFAKRRHNARA